MAFIVLKFPHKDLYNREKRWQVIEKNIQKLGDSFKSSIPWAKYHLEMRYAGKNAKDNKKNSFDYDSVQNMNRKRDSQL